MNSSNYREWRRTHPPMKGGAPLTIEEFEQRQDEIRGRLAELDTEYQGQSLPEGFRDEWNTLNDEYERNSETLREMRDRQARIRELAGDPRNVEGERHSFNVGRSGGPTGDIWDVMAVRAHAHSPQEESRLLRDNAMRAVERSSFPHPEADRERCQGHIAKLMERFEGEDQEYGSGAVSVLSRRILTTGSPTYKRAFGKVIAGRPLTTEEQRSMSLTAASGGYAVPYTLDPTVIPTSNSSVNPYRAISRVVQGVTDDWKGVSSAGVTASYAAENAEVADGSPTFAQPAVSAERAHVFIQYSFELGQDWGSLLSEMAIMIQDSKDDLEAGKFTTGAGSGSSEPQGILTGATGTVAAGSAAFAVAHLYALENALGARFRPRAQFVGNRATYNLARQFDTAGGASLWIENLRTGLENNVPTAGNLGARLLGYPASEASSYVSVLTAGSKILTLGDWRYFLIYDRIGMNVEIVPHVFGASLRPTGQRGLYAFWRNSSGVLATGAFKTLQTT